MSNGEKQRNRTRWKKLPELKWPVVLKLWLSAAELQQTPIPDNPYTKISRPSIDYMIPKKKAAIFLHNLINSAQISSHPCHIWSKKQKSFLSPFLLVLVFWITRQNKCQNYTKKETPLTTPTTTDYGLLMVLENTGKQRKRKN